MCGIAGIVNFNKMQVDNSILWQMTDALAHRGPDDRGVYIDNFIGFGHRRLSIIDLSERGHQPMHTENKDFVITYNGEVYNFKELRKKLEREGLTFKSLSDTEVVLKSFMRWGANSLNHFNGMFAFAVWDSKNKALILARDRYGMKPLYYWQNDKVFLFASEIKAFLKHPQFRVELDLEALLEYFTFQNTFTYRTLFKGVKLLSPGHYMRLSFKDNLNIKTEQYWDFNFAESTNIKSESEYLEELDRLFKQAVKRQLVSDVELGSYLSGGIDSGAIAAVASRQLPYIKTFTCGFDLHSVSGLEVGCDERAQAELMSYKFKTEHFEIVLKSGDMEKIIPNLVWSLEDLRVGQSYPNFYIAQLASKLVKVVFSGAGGDELFGGYPWRYYQAVHSDNFDQYIDKYYIFWQRLIDNRHLKEVFKPVSNHVKHVWTRDIFRDVFKKHTNHINTPEEYINHSLYFEAKTFLHGLLVVEDKLSMAHGLEIRAPFLDNDLVDFAMRLPIKHKLKNINKIMRTDENEIKKYFTDAQNGKLLMRKMAKAYIPKEIANARKQGFCAPDASWFKGESIQYIRAQLFNNHARIYNFFDRAAVQRLVSAHLRGKVNRRLFIWSLLNFEWWLKTYYEC